MRGRVKMNFLFLDNKVWVLYPMIRPTLAFGQEASFDKSLDCFLLYGSHYTAGGGAAGAAGGEASAGGVASGGAGSPGAAPFSCCGF